MEAPGATILYLTHADTAFHQSPGHMLHMTVREERFEGVFLHCSFPHSMPRSYISVRSADGKEIGVIRSVNDFPEDERCLLEEHIRLRYFAPEITRVIRIKEEFGYTYWETETTAGNCRFTVRGGGGHVKFVTERKLMVIDVDGNRFVVSDIGKLSDKEYGMIEMYL